MKEVIMKVPSFSADYPKAPIYVADLVKCKECKWVRYCETEDLDLYLDCDKPDGGGIPRSEDWFCADGEREGE